MQCKSHIGARRNNELRPISDICVSWCVSVQITRVYQFCATLPDNDTSVLVTGDAEQNVEEIGVAGWQAALVRCVFFVRCSKERFTVVEFVASLLDGGVA